ncbi:SusC/RagA family TonB-linked outer membrane protein [Chitinophaga varians]|uniref:SusC/RagA family TonB-linked outer membrane protein n=1 Tax=Chitinophaga varians TaxID=2202339 RepID=UPI00165F3758|nr:SusC/RagA family TonB-linked outer membrane protein [Chitinophaga varians]MBC9912381.1 SusC/RagA family TonB-linked outer membrane protein [Chitinophaga varians]
MKTLKFYCTVILIVFTCAYAAAQEAASVLSKRVALDVTEKPVPEILSLIEKQLSISFAYPNEIVNGRGNFSFKEKSIPLENVLKVLFPAGSFQIKAMGSHVVIKQLNKPPGAVIQLKGRVLDKQTGEALPGAVITDRESNKSVVSGEDGSFTLPISQGSTYSVAFMGYETTSQTAGSTRATDILLPRRISEMNTVVVTALGIGRQQRSLGYAYTDLKGNEFTKARENNPIASLSGKVAGLDVSMTNSGVGASVKVTLRGVKVVGGDNQPLYVIDGVPINNSSPGQADKYGGYDLGDGTSIINPDEIETMSVLKGGAATALYGSRASNGVILITTKKGNNKGLEVEVTSNTVLEKLNNSYDFQEEYGMGRTGQLPRDAATARTYSQSSWGPRFHADSLTWLWNGQKMPYVKAANPIQKFFREGLTLSNSVALATGNDKSQLRFTYTNLHNKDIVPTSGLDRHNFALRGTSRLTDKLSIDAKVAYLSEKVNNRPALSDNPNNVGYVLSGIAPNISIDWLKEYKDPVTGNYIDWNNDQYQVNPYWALNEQPNNSKQDRLTGFALLKYQLTPYLTIQGRTGTDYSKFSFREFIELSSPFNTTGGINMKDRTLRETNSELLLTFSKQVKNFQIGANLGTNRMDYEETVLNTTGRDISTRGVKSINNFQTKLSNELINRKRINSVYGAVSLSYKNYLYLDITGRNDWSSTLAAGNNAFFYPSVSTSFVFSELMPQNELLNFGKIRLSIAQTGADAVDPYQLKLTYASNPDIPTIGGYSIGGVGVDRVPYEALKPSISKSYEAGLNLVMLKNRVNLDVTFYQSNTRNQVLYAPISSTSGYTTAVINSGNVQNKGVEIALGLKPVTTKHFSWDLNLTWACNVNKILELSPLVSGFYTLASARWANASIVAQEGEEYGIIVGRKFLRDDQGNMILDEKLLPRYDAADTRIGGGQYKWIGGLNNRFAYKNFTLSILLDVKHGGNIYSMTNLRAYATGRHKGTLDGREGWAQSEKERVAAGVEPGNWKPTGGVPVSGVQEDGVDGNGNKKYKPVSGFVSPQVYWNTITDNIPEAFIYDASFVKVRQITLDYRLPQSVLRKTMIRDVTLSLVARNPFIVSKHVPNIDPQSSYNNSNGQGFEYGSLPTRRSYGINLYAKF